MESHDAAQVTSAVLIDFAVAKTFPVMNVMIKTLHETLW